MERSEKILEIVITSKNYDFFKRLLENDKNTKEQLESCLWDYENKNIRICRNCNSSYISQNNKTKYCEVCRQPEIMGKIRYANRKSNKARKLHQEVLTLTYGFAKKPNNDSNAFLNESNYYWDIVQGKKPEKVKGYSNRIKTEEQYISWLERKRDEYKGVIL